MEIYRKICCIIAQADTPKTDDFAQRASIVLNFCFSSVASTITRIISTTCITRDDRYRNTRDVPAHSIVELFVFHGYLFIFSIG